MGVLIITLLIALSWIVQVLLTVHHGQAARALESTLAETNYPFLTPGDHPYLVDW